MARDLQLNVTSKSSGAGLQAAAAEVSRLGREADRMGDQFKQATRDAAKLDRQLLETAAAAKLLAHEFASVDDPASRAALKSKIDANRSAAAELKRLRAEMIGDSGKDSQAATNAWKKALSDFNKASKSSGTENASTFAAAFQGGIINAFKALPPEAKAAVVEGLIVSIVAADAPIGAAINGVMLAGIGLGGIGLGIAGQLDNPKVQAAGKQLGTDLKAQLTKATAGFADPIVASAQILDTSLGHTLDGLKGDLDDLSRHLEPLARGIAGLFEKAFGGQGFADALEAAGPIIDDLAENLDRLGQNVDRAFALLADGSEGAKDGLDLLFLTIETLIVGVAALIDGFSHLYHAFLAPGKAIFNFFDGLDGVIDPVAHSLVGAAGGMDEFGNAFEQGIGSVGDFKNAITDAAATVDTQWAGAIDAVVGTMLSLDRATLGWDETLTKVGESIKQNGKTLDEHTKKGQANRDALLDGVQANLRLFDAEVKAGGSAQEAGRKFKQHNDDLRAAAIAAGLNAGEVDKMIKKYGQVPPEIETQIRMKGLETALNNLDETLRLINHLPKRPVDVGINVHVGGNLFAAANAIGDILGSGFVSSGLGKRKKALGGPVKANEAYIVGDAGRPELFVPDTNGTILPRVPDTIGQAAPSIASRLGGGGTAAQAITVTLNFAGSDTAMGTAVHKLIREGYAQLRAVDSAGNSLPVKVA